MATHWLKALGTKLLDTGAAYLQQARLVQELKGLPPEQARSRFFAYVDGLSASARAGFALTLTALAKAETADGRRFLETLRAALTDRAAWSIQRVVAPPKPGAKPAPPPPPKAAPKAAPKPPPAHPVAQQPATFRESGNRPPKPCLPEVIALLQDLRTGILEGTIETDFQQWATGRVEQLNAFSDAEQVEIGSVAVFALQMMIDTFAESSIDDPATLGQLQSDLAQAERLADQALGVDSPWARSRRVVVEMAQALAAGKPAPDALAEATAALARVPDLSKQARAQASFGLHALERHHRWMEANETGAPDSALKPWQELRGAMPRSGATPAWVARAVQACEDCTGPDDVQAADARATLALALAGLALDARPDLLPGLAPLAQLVFESLAAIRRGQSAPAPSDFGARCDAIIARFDTRAASEGFSEYALREAFNDIKALPRAEGDGDRLREGLVTLLGHSAAVAPADWQASLRETQESLADLDAAPATTLDFGSWSAQGEAILHELRGTLTANGGDLAAPITRALLALQALAPLAPDDERAADLMMQWTSEYMEVLAAHVPEHQRAQARQLAQPVQDVAHAAPRLMRLEGAEADIEANALRSSVTRIAQVASPDIASADGQEQAISALLLTWLARLASLDDCNEGMDGREAQRLRGRAQEMIERARGLTLQAHLLEQLQRFIRPLAFDVWRFERRRHLTLIEPPWSTQEVMADPNAVFSCVSPPHQALVAGAYESIGMYAVVRSTQADPAQARWLELRAAAVAIFDFSTYDRVACDPPELPVDEAASVRLLDAAAPTARSAFELGWALLLGVPIVVLARAGQAMPFDIDVAPTVLTGDEQDVERLALALMRATLGMQRPVSGDGLEHTLNLVRTRLAQAQGRSGALETVTQTGDALRVRSAVELALRDLNVSTPGLCVLPVAPASARYKTSELFHVTAFRPWMATVEDVLRKSCAERGIAYRIGHEDLDPQILRAVWQALAGASHVVCDITLLNPNAVLELAVAQAMGRPVLILSRHAATSRWLPMLEKIRVHRYDVDAAGLQRLRQLVSRFLQTLG